MRKIKAIYSITRPVNIIITILSVFVAGVIALNNNFIPIELFWSAVAEAFAFSAGNIINDIFDLEIDRINRPDRVLPGKKLKISEAYSLYVVCLIASVIISFMVNLYVFLIIIFTNILLYLYSYIIKKIVVASNLTVALIFASPFLLGALTVGNINGGIIPFVFAFLIHFSREIVKDMEDISGDLSQNYGSIPLKFGFANAVKLVIYITAILILFTFYPYITGIYSLTYFLIIFLILIPFLIYVLYKLYKDRSNRNLKRISFQLKLNMIIGLIAIYFA